jgi:hypothetical protein
MFRIVHRAFPASRILFLGAAVAAGCRSVAPAPIDWPREAAAWSAAVTNRVTLTAASARDLARVLNPEINALRLSRQNADREALAAGWWEDPAFDLESLRVLRGGPHPWILGAGLRFSLPLSGVPGLEKRAALAYARADALAVVAAERELLAEVERRWLACATDARCAAAQEAYLHASPSASGRSPRWWPPASCRPTSANASRRNAGPETACPCFRPRRSRAGTPCCAHSACIPTRRWSWMSRPSRSPTHCPPRSALHPRPTSTSCATARAGAAGAFRRQRRALRAELRRQYPELELGPLAGHEEGGARAGLGVGFTLPLWNRNRRGVAEAESARDSTRFEAVTAWRALVAEWHEARAALLAAETLERRLREERLAAAQAAAARTRRLYAQGEAALTELIAAEAAVYAIHEAWIEAGRGLDEARIRLALLATGGRQE